MKKVLLTLTAGMVAALALMAKGDKDPVLMTVDNKPVKLSEFEYLYQKNNTQQVAVQPVDEYLDLFVIYKLKVAEAESEGIDQTEAFQNEYAGYCRDLSEPYLIDKSARDSVVRLIYDRFGEEIDVSHIMIDRADGLKAAEAQKAKLNDVRQAILDGKVTFEQMADSLSIDKAARRNHGRMGYISSGMLPYTFEDAAYETPVGEISPVIETPFGYHIVYVHGRRPNPGKVKVQHILKLTNRSTPEEAEAKKQQIDSIYNLVIAGADFSDIASRESEDPGSASHGGQLDWFGSRQMVPEFEEVAFALNNGEISKPFKTSYGYHIIHKLDSKGIESFDDLQPRIENFVNRDERQFIPRKKRVAELRKKYDTTVKKSIADDIRSKIEANGALDSTLVATFLADDREIIDLNGNNDGVTVAQLFEVLPTQMRSMALDQALMTFENRLTEAGDDATLEAERNALYDDNADYRNLLNEYRDGMLLFEISDRNVWGKSKSDTEGLNNYFNANRAKYSNWKAPKFKGYVIFATSDSISSLAQQYLADHEVADSDLVDTMRKEFGKNIKVERVLAAEGDNAIIDGLAFGKATPDPTGKWVKWFAYKGKIVGQPEEPADERGAVTTDYQNELEANWVKELRKKHKVKIDKKVLQKYKAALEAENNAPAQ